MRVDQYSTKWFFALVSLLGTAALIAGCGGGGGGGGSSTTTSGSTGSSNLAFSGTVTESVVSGTGTPLPGYTVSFDGNSSYQSVTNTNGAFSISVPSSAITGSDQLNVYSSSGTLSGAYTITSAQEGGATGISITIGPPPAPPLIHVLTGASSK